MSDMVDRAILFATRAHKDATRKGTATPYIFHPLEAAAIVATMTDDEEILSAAILHDVIEDTEYTAETIRQEFGTVVEGYVLSESENKRENLPAADTWKIRKEETLERLSEDCLPAKMIALGDKLSNIRAIYRDYLKLGDALWERFNQKDPALQGWYYRSMISCFSDLKEYPVYAEYTDLVHRVFGE